MKLLKVCFFICLCFLLVSKTFEEIPKNITVTFIRARFNDASFPGKEKTLVLKSEGNLPTNLDTQADKLKKFLQEIIGNIGDLDGATFETRDGEPDYISSFSICLYYSKDESYYRLSFSNDYNIYEDYTRVFRVFVYDEEYNNCEIKRKHYYPPLEGFFGFLFKKIVNNV